MSSDNESTVAAVAVKLPAIWSDNPATWFFQAEAQFAIKGITVEKPKYFYVVANLPAEVAIRVASFLEVVPEVKPYDTLKGALLSAYTLNEYQRAEALANLPPLGDQRPSELLAQIRQLLPVGHKDCFRSKYDFLSRLPVEIRSTLVNSSLELDALAAEADNLWSAVRGNTFNHLSVVDTVQVDAVHRRSSKLNGSVNARHNQARDSRPAKFCWYHRNFADKARDCKDVESGVPCNWPGNGVAGRSN